MKQVKFRGKANGKIVRGNWLCSNRPKNAQRIAERLAGYRLTNFISVTSDVKLTMINCEVKK